MSVHQNIKLSVDAVVFGYTSVEGLSVLLINRTMDPFRGQWALPGGLVRDDESLEEAVARELHEETGVSINYLEQLYSFGEPGRDPRNRVVSVAYYGLVKPNAFRLTTSNEASEVAWFDVRNLPALAFDHNQIIEVAIQRLRNKMQYEPIGFELLDQKFPFSELEKLYTTVLDRPIDRRNFKKKIMRFGFLEETTERQQLAGAGRPGKLYRFNETLYFATKKRGISFEL